MSQKPQTDGFQAEAQRDVNIYQQALKGDAQAKASFSVEVNGWLAADNGGLRNIQKILQDMQGINPAAAAAYNNAFQAERNHYSPNPDVVWREGTGQ
jgi:hypothetical protein